MCGLPAETCSHVHYDSDSAKDALGMRGTHAQIGKNPSDKIISVANKNSASRLSLSQMPLRTQSTPSCCL